MVTEQQLNKMPIIETKVFKSKDGNFIVHKTIIVDIKPTKYYDAVMESNGEDLTV